MKLVLTTRELTEIGHSLDYARNYAHGTVGHNLFVLVSKLATHIGFDIDHNQDLVLPVDTMVSIVEETRKT